MKITTVFDVGDSFYTLLAERPILGNQPWKWDPDGYKRKVYKTTIIINKKGVQTFYITASDFWCVERNCFKTKKEAQEECQRRNKEMRK